MIRGKGGLVRVIGHRGAMGHAPENTLPSFARAIEMGADFLECDVHLTRDGVPVVIHDAGLERTTNGSGAVRERTWDEIGRLDAGSWFGGKAHAGARVPPLEAVLELARGRCGVLVEIKGGILQGVEEAVARRIERCDAESWAGVIASDPRCLERIRTISPRTNTALVSGMECATPLASARSAGANGLVPEASTVTPKLVSAAAAAGLWVAPWTINDPAAARTMARMGVDGVISNYPDRMQACRLGALRTHHQTPARDAL